MVRQIFVALRRTPAESTSKSMAACVSGLGEWSGTHLPGMVDHADLAGKAPLRDHISRESRCLDDVGRAALTSSAPYTSSSATCLPSQHACALCHRRFVKDVRSPPELLDHPGPVLEAR